MELTAEELWACLPGGYLLTIAIEIPILLIGLSPSHPRDRRLIAGCWLTACTYPIVILVLPWMVGTRWGYAAYLAVAETFAELDLEEIADYIARDNLHRALSFIGEIRERCQNIVNFPEAAPLREEFGAGIRVIPFGR